MPSNPRGKGKTKEKEKGGKKQTNIVAKPAVETIPTNLHVAPSSDRLPIQIVEAFPEFGKAQTFFSALEHLMPEFESSMEGYQHCWFGINENLIDRIERPDSNTFLATLHLKDGTENPMFVKRIHLLEPVTAMEGEYLWPEDGSLPNPSGRWSAALDKINNPLNEAYVDSVFAACASKLVEGGYSPGWCKCYGTFTARAEKYLYNVSDEISSMRNKSWWKRNQRLGIFKILKNDDSEERDISNFFTEGLTEIEADDFIEALEEEVENTEVESEVIQEPEIETEPMLEAVKLATPKLRLKRLTKSNASEASEESYHQFQQYAEFSNFPVQVTLLEQADGTLDSLIEEEEISETKWASWLFQVIAALTVAQHWYGFVHNDLHTNNVMWSKTETTHIYYRIHKGKGKEKEVSYKKIPTFEKIMKIIDFGRASFTLPEPAGFMISDAFFPGNDAADQYNCDPFFDPKEGKKVEPNPSFDLCRLSVSLIESLFTERPESKNPVVIMSREDNGKKLYPETKSPVYNLLWSWLLDDEGKNVLRKSNGEERYPDFDLYRAIAADVHHALPKLQIEKPIFDEFNCSAKDIPASTPIYDLYI
jgi:serine/threonine protein kinase